MDTIDTTASAANPVVELDVSGTPTPFRRPALAEVTVTPLPIQVDMNKLIGVIFARLSAIEGRLAALERGQAAAASCST
jgi:hypothetical protein